MSRSETPRLHVVTDDAVLRRPDFHGAALEVLEEGGARIAFHVRGPGCTGAEVYRIARALAPTAEAFGVRLLVNDRVDVALALGLSGVHLGRRSVPPQVARELLGAQALLGVSTHSDAELAEAAQGGADYVFAGAIYPTESHPGGPARGLDALEAVAPDGPPVLAIGGIDVPRVADVMAAGAHGMAVIGGVWGAPHPRGAVIRYLHALDSAAHGGATDGPPETGGS